MGISAADGTTAWVLGRCRELGFALSGVAPAERTNYEREFREWIGAGRQGEMEYLARNLDVRLDPAGLVPGATSVICVADRYHDGESDGPEVQGSAAQGRIARYARGDDYHKVMKRRLHGLADELRRALPGEVFRVCVDTAPLLERELAQRAGLGAVGKHTLLIEPGVGSWLLLGEIVTTAPLTPAAPGPADPCGDCTRCLDACPTGAIAPWSVDATRCLSYLTIEHRTAVDEGYHEPSGAWIFGCDVCQEVCPHNQPTERSRALPIPDAYAPRRDAFDLLEVLGWDEPHRRDAFTRSALKRAKLAMMKRNALVAAGNALAIADRPVLRQRVETVAADPDEDDVVRATARAVLTRLAGRAGRS